MRHHIELIVLVCAMELSSLPALAQFSQQGPKLVGTGAVGIAVQGRSVSLSADGNTAIIGGSADNGGAGAAWAWTRNGGAWAQQGTKLVGSGAVVSTFGAGQGVSVSLSADGNTAIVGGNNDTGTWVWTRSGGVWTQQGAKLVPSGVPGFGFAGQGASVSLSADGNTAIIGGPHYDNTNLTGAAWVWTRSGGVWTQQGSRLFGSGAVGAFVRQGASVALSADGNTAMIGGPGDNGGAGAAWVWTRSGGVWTQQGSKLFGSGAVGNVGQGGSVSLSADGNTAIVGGPGVGAWVWTRAGGIWIQQGSKLFGSGGPVVMVAQGYSVSLSADGNTAIVGGFTNGSLTAAAWAWTRSGGVWTQQGTMLVGSGAVGVPSPDVSVALSADGKKAIVGGASDNGGIGAAWIFAAGPTPLVLNCPSGTGTANVPYGSVLAASGGAPPYSVGITNGVLPRGLTMNLHGGVSGTPAVSGIFPFSVSVHDASGQTATASCTLTIAPSSCTYSLSYTSRIFTKDGGAAAVNVTASNTSCPVYSISSVDWIILASPQPQNGSGTVNYTVQPNSGQSRNATIAIANQSLLIIQEGTTACQVPPLTPLTDPLTLFFENGNGNEIDVVHLTPSTNQARLRLEGSLPGARLLSAYRPTEYQKHFVEIWDKADLLEGDTGTACAALKQQVLYERDRKHNLGEVPSHDRSAHEDGRAVDYDIQDTSTNRAIAIGSGFLQNRIRRHKNGGLHLESGQ